MGIDSDYFLPITDTPKPYFGNPERKPHQPTNYPLILYGGRSQKATPHRRIKKQSPH
jgi:hypothetical protein